VIAKEYETLVLQDNNVLRVKIISANELKKAQLQDLKKSLSIKYPGKTIDKKDIKDKGDYYTVVVKDPSGGSQKVKFNAFTGEYEGKVSS
jgi:hypothetical protein